jgi:hypothetical protein
MIGDKVYNIELVVLGQITILHNMYRCKRERESVCVCVCVFWDEISMRV